MNFSDIAVGILCDFAKVSLSTLKLVIENKRLVGEWVGLLKSSSKPEMSGAVLHSIARVLYQEDGVYAGSSNAPETVFSGVPSTTEEFGKLVVVASYLLLIPTS